MSVVSHREGVVMPSSPFTTEMCHWHLTCCSCTIGVTCRRGQNTGRALLRTARCNSATSSVRSCRSGWLCSRSQRWIGNYASWHLSQACWLSCCQFTSTVEASQPTLCHWSSAFASLSSLGYFILLPISLTL